MDVEDSGFRIQVIGGGSWGLALARHLANRGHAVSLWCRAEDQPERLRETRYSPFFLPKTRLPERVAVSTEMLDAPDLAVFAVPSHAMAGSAERFRFPATTVRVSVAKGIEENTLRRMSEVLADADPASPVAALSGPSHAEEVASDLPASLVAAAASAGIAERIQAAFFAPHFRVYTSTDIAGVELGGALKNVIAIAAGACDGLGLGDNARAALITRGLAEIQRLGVACGADPLTFAGLSGLGDLIVTCGSSHSRNRRLGEGLAKGHSLEALTSGTPMVAEGVRTAASAHALATKCGVDMPITTAVHRVLFEGMAPLEAVSQLLQRESRPEQG